MARMTIRDLIRLQNEADPNNPGAPNDPSQFETPLTNYDFYNQFGGYGAVGGLGAGEPLNLGNQESRSGPGLGGSQTMLDRASLDLANQRIQENTRTPAFNIMDYMTIAPNGQGSFKVNPRTNQYWTPQEIAELTGKDLYTVQNAIYGATNGGASNPSLDAPGPNAGDNQVGYYNAGVNTPQSPVDVAAQAAKTGAVLPPGALTLASLLSYQQPKSWNTPGIGYGTENGRINYWNQAGRPFREGEDTESYWYDPHKMAWDKGSLSGEIKPAPILPWAQVPWTTQEFKSPDQGQIAYFNAQGEPYKPGDEQSFWYDAATQKWKQGDLTGKISTATKLPWRV